MSGESLSTLILLGSFLVMILQGPGRKLREKSLRRVCSTE